MQTATQFITYHQQQAKAQAICMLHVMHYGGKREKCSGLVLVSSRVIKSKKFLIFDRI
jgi:hypothetical protein